MTDKEEEIELVNLQLVATFLFLISVLISFSLSYDKLQSLVGGKRLYTAEEVMDINYLNSYLIILIVVIYLYVNYENVQRAKRQNRDTSNLYLQELNSILALTAAFISLYVVNHTTPEDPSDEGINFA